MNKKMVIFNTFSTMLTGINTWVNQMCYHNHRNGIDTIVFVCSKPEKSYIRNPGYDLDSVTVIDLIYGTKVIDLEISKEILNNEYPIWLAHYLTDGWNDIASKGYDPYYDMALFYAKTRRRLNEVGKEFQSFNIFIQDNDQFNPIFQDYIKKHYFLNPRYDYYIREFKIYRPSFKTTFLRYLEENDYRDLLDGRELTENQGYIYEPSISPLHFDMRLENKKGYFGCTCRIDYRKPIWDFIELKGIKRRAVVSLSGARPEEKDRIRPYLNEDSSELLIFEDCAQSPVDKASVFEKCSVFYNYATLHDDTSPEDVHSFPEWVMLEAIDYGMVPVGNPSSVENLSNMGFRYLTPNNAIDLAKEFKLSSEHVSKTLLHNYNTLIKNAMKSQYFKQFFPSEEF